MADVVTSDAIVKMKYIEINKYMPLIILRHNFT